MRVPFIGLSLSALLLLCSWHCGQSGSGDNSYKGRIRESIRFDASGKPVIITRYEYDPNGNVIREFTRDSSSAGIFESERLYEYADNRRTRIIANDPPGTLDYTWHFEYDSSGRLLREYGRFPTDSIFEEIEYRRNASGKIIEERVTRGGAVMRSVFTYDDLGRLITSRQFGPAGHVVMTNSFTYGNDTLPDTVRFMSGSFPTRTLVYEYDSAGRKVLEKQLRPDGSAQHVRALAYDRDGNTLFDENYASGLRIDYLYKDSVLVEERHQQHGRLVGVVYYE